MVGLILGTLDLGTALSAKCCRCYDLYYKQHVYLNSNPLYQSEYYNVKHFIKVNIIW
jgi:hypothetical protein